MLSALVVGSLMATSCKETKKTGKEVVNATENAVDKTVDATKNAADKVVDVTKDAATKVVDATTETAKDAVSKVEETVTSAIEGVTIPKFEDAKVNEYVKSYSEYAKKYIDAKGDVLKNASLAKEGVKYANQAKELLKNMDAETAKKFNSVMNAIKSKMAPAK